jgi:polysaccharide biosynthesis protein PslA
MNKRFDTLPLKAERDHVARATKRTQVSDFRTLRLRLYFVIAIADGLAMLTAFMLADLLRFGQAQGYGVTTFMIMFPTYAAVGFNGDTWSLKALRSPRHSAGSAVRAVFFAIAVSTIIFFTLKIGADFSRPVFGIGSVLAVMLIAGGRLVLGRSFGEHYGWSFRKEVLLIDGVEACPEAEELIFDARSEGVQPTTDNPEILDRLARILHGCERAVVACPVERRQEWSRALAGANVDAEILTPELSAVGALGLRRHAGTPTLLVGCGPLALRDRAAKRLFDITLSGAALTLLLPVLAIVALAISLESPGPVFFRQQRMGRGNRLFEILKFRSMRMDSCDHSGDRSAARGDDRITRVGRFIRRTSLDELPQIINVLKGEMSIVGPRPHALGSKAEDMPFWAIDDRYFDRHAIKPGMTGLAQVRGFRGATHKVSDVTDRVRADLEYLEGWHLGRDIAIIARTVGVLVHPNAF